MALAVCLSLRAFASREITDVTAGVADILDPALVSHKDADGRIAVSAAAALFGGRSDAAARRSQMLQRGECGMAMKAPSMDEWIKEAKAAPGAESCGMYLFHNGVVRRTSKAAARQGKHDEAPVAGMDFACDAKRAEAAVGMARAMPGIHYVRVWLNRGALAPGDDIMLVLVGGDIRPHVVDALQALVGELKQHCVTEREIFDAPPKG